MSKLRSAACAIVAIAAFVIAGCGGSDEGDGGGSAGKQDKAVVTEARNGLQALKTSVLSTGPNGEKPTPASQVTLSPEELQQIRTSTRPLRSCCITAATTGRTPR